jgi:hypothetical protein
MKIDTEHLHFWMQAIRQSNNPMRTLDAFWSGQLKSKEWLIDTLIKHIHSGVDIDIHGGWVGVLASMLFQSKIPVWNIRSIDIDPHCEQIANTMNKKEEMSGHFKAITANMCNIITEADVIINTSCEHITQEEYEQWLNNIPSDSLIVLQSNNYQIDEHIRIANSLEHFKEQSHINVFESVELELPLYTRYMIIGEKIV